MMMNCPWWLSSGKDGGCESGGSRLTQVHVVEHSGDTCDGGVDAVLMTWSLLLIEVVLNAVVCSALLKEMTCDIDVPLLYCDFEAVSNTVD